MYSLILIKFERDFLKLAILLVFLQSLRGFHKTYREVACANTISALFKRVSVQLSKCELRYI